MAWQMTEWPLFGHGKYEYSCFFCCDLAKLENIMMLIFFLFDCRGQTKVTPSVNGFSYPVFSFLSNDPAKNGSKYSRVPAKYTKCHIY